MNDQTSPLKLFMVLLGARPTGRNVEQHDIFFGVASNIKELAGSIKDFWPEAKKSIHLDGWREVKNVDGFNINVVSISSLPREQSGKLFFINLGGYLENRLEEQHFNLLVIGKDMSEAIKKAKQSLFFKHNNMPGAPSHVDDKFEIDVDEAYLVDDLLQGHYALKITPASQVSEDKIVLGYFKLDKL